MDQNVTTIALDKTFHIEYGVKYPITFQFDIPDENQDLSVYKRYKQSDEWLKVKEKTADDFYNGIDAARFDYINSFAFLSISFDERSDSVFIQIRDSSGKSVPASYARITKYYDNRDAAVTATADDWADWCDQKFVQSCRIFRDHQLWLSTAIISGTCSTPTWKNIQTQLDSGYVEAIAHSRSHPHVPYADYKSEVTGCKYDLLRYLVLPPLFRKSIKEYVYIWVAPFGDYDYSVDVLLRENKFLATRMYLTGFHTYADWDARRQFFGPVGVSCEMGPKLIMDDPWYATDDIEELNACFDSVFASKGIYHLMLHPNAMEWDKDYGWQHLAHISQKKDIWYVATGHLYLYHLIEENAPEPELLTISSKMEMLPERIALNQNYPNPFNPTTKIDYELQNTSYIELSIFNILGQQIQNLVAEEQPPGKYSIEWDAAKHSSGIYFYVLQSSEGEVLMRKMMLLR